jgi:hypothetical protein
MLDRSRAFALLLALSSSFYQAGQAHAGESYAQAVTDLVVFQTDLGHPERHPTGDALHSFGGQGSAPADQADYFNVSIKVPEGTTPYLTLGWGRLDQAPGWRLTANVGTSSGKGKASGAAHLAAPGISPTSTEQTALSVRPDASQAKASPQLTLGASYRY